ncbi:MAG: O-antigen ligase family protein, partial [Blastocatellia bacterium]
GYMEMLAPIPLALVLAKAVDREKRALYVFATVIAVIAAVASLSRGGMLSLGAEAVFLTSWTFRRGHRRSSYAVKTKLDYVAQGATIAAVLGAIGLGLLWIGAEPIINRAAETVQELQTKDADYLSRQWIWKDTLSMVRAHPVTGAGLGAFRTVFPVYAHGNGDQIVAQSHNDYLQILADCGVIGVLLAAGFLICLFNSVRAALGVASKSGWNSESRNAKGEDRVAAGLALGCSAGLLAMLVHSMFDFNLQIPSNALLFLFLSGVVSVIGAAARQGEKRSENRNTEVDNRIALSRV